MLHKLQGMFAILIWDIKKKEGFSARDPYGIKPLYIGSNSKGLILASQVKTLLSTKKINIEKDSFSEFSFKNFGYVIEPNTWFKDIKSLKSGYYIIIRDNKIVTENQWFNTENLWVSADKSNDKISKEECGKLEKDACASTSCCVLLGGSRCVGGNEKGPTMKANYGDITIINRDHYFYKGKCYGNCPR